MPHTIYHCRNLDGQIKISCKETGINQIAIGGGVSANSGIRKAIKDAEQMLENICSKI
jgi:tRNA A37 threonylcarbamoyltransferase TsaD